MTFLVILLQIGDVVSVNVLTLRDRIENVQKNQI